MPQPALLQKVSTYVFVLFSMLIASTMFSCIFGNVTGTEFNPYTFQSRSFYYTEVPFVHLQLRPTQRTVETNALQTWITSGENLLTNSSETRWDLVEGARIGIENQMDRSKTLHQYLNASNHDGELIWLEWSKAHRKSARKLWPAIAWLGQADLYYLVPDVMNFAKRQGDSTDFADLLDEELAKLAGEAADKLAKVDPDRAAAIRSDVASKHWHSLERPPGSGPAAKAEADDPSALVAPPGAS